MTNYKDFKVTIKGSVPMLHDRFNPPVQGVAKGRSKKVYNPKEEATRKLYLNSEDKVIQPAIHIEASLIRAASNFQMKGHKTFRDVVKACVVVKEREIFFEIPKEVTKEGKGWVIDEQPVVIQRARVLTWRPRFDEWQLSFIIRNLQPDVLDDATLKEMLEYAGTFVAIGAFRPKYGRFEVISFEPIEK